MLTLANARVYGEKLENESPFVEQEELKNENPCGDPELLTALESMCDSSDMLTSHDSFFSKDEGLLWCDTCGHGLADLGSLTQHVLEHIADSIENTKDSNVPHTTQRDLMIRQKPITDGDVEKSIENTKDSNVLHTTQRDLMIRKKPITDGDVEKKMWDTEQVQQLNPQWESVSVGQVKTTANQNVAILPVNDPHMPMLSISCDSKSNVSHGRF
ncbi:hypothetical protein DPMN_143787 [Dreissena polymorpha]|uniref:C2H2-type domain-containing protein n=1 Tax=Dreissena polymorpha TaxID=45954 RepID=A0A9D4GHP7_DREPO|nr:hypothetical protein DPMN_143787 [Dreissena polymorpha]